MININLPLLILKPHIDRISKRCSLLYGINTKILVDRMKSVNQLMVVDNLPKNTVMQTNFEYLHNKPYTKILINSNYCRYQNTILISFMKTETYFEVHSLIHELLHVASKNSVTSGLLDIGPVDYTGLNEGVTQMFADDICGYVENKYVKSYNELKVFAKIIRSTFGNNVICEAYFKNSSVLRNKFYDITKNSKYYDTFNAKLTALQILFSKINASQNSEIMKELYDRKVNSLLNDLIINIVIPYANKLNNSEKEKYIKRLMLDLDGDESIKSQVKNKLINLINANKYVLKNETVKQINNDNRINSDNYFIDLMEKEGDSAIKRLYIDRDGKIYFLGSNKEITSPILCSKIYEILYDSGSIKYGKITLPFLNKIIDQINKYGYVNIPGNDILERRKVFCAIKRAFREKGIYLCNDYRELDNSKYIDNPILIKTSINYLKLNDINRLINNYVIYDTDSGKNTTRKIVNRNTNIPVEDEFLRKMVLFAYDFYISVGVKSNSNKLYLDLDDKIFDDILDAFKICYLTKYDLNIDYIIKSCNYLKSREIVSKLLSDPIKYEWLFEIFELNYGSSVNEKRSKTVNELRDSNYSYKVASKDADEILRHK